MNSKSDDSEKEIDKRRDEIARRMLSTPPKPRKTGQKKGDGPKQSRRPSKPA